MTRIHFTDEIYLLKAIFEDFKKGKKPVKGFKKQCGEMCNNLLDELFKIMTETKLKDREHIEKEWMSEVCSKRDEILERVTVMNMKDLKNSYYIA